MSSDSRPNAASADSHAQAPAWHTLISTLALQPHPEGGYYREVFRSEKAVGYRAGERSALTSILYLLAEGAFSAWHRIDADEAWYFHKGNGLKLHVLHPDGRLETHHLGDPLVDPQAVMQAVVPAGCWFAAEPASPQDYALVGCAVAPGFEFSGFELATENDLEPAVRQHGDWLRRLLHPAMLRPA